MTTTRRYSAAVHERAAQIAAQRAAELQAAEAAEQARENAEGVARHGAKKWQRMKAREAEQSARIKEWAAALVADWPPPTAKQVEVIQRFWLSAEEREQYQYEQDLEQARAELKAQPIETRLSQYARGESS